MTILSLIYFIWHFKEDYTIFIRSKEKKSREFVDRNGTDRYDCPCKTLNDCFKRKTEEFTGKELDLEGVRSGDMHGWWWNKP